MTKQEIYGQIVRLTLRLKKTGMPQRICWALADDDVEEIDTLIDAFPMYCPGLYNQIYTFGQVFGKLVGDSEEENEEFKAVQEDCGNMMFRLAETGVISRIAESIEVGDDKQVLKIIKEYCKENSFFVANLIKFQYMFTQFCSSRKSGKEGEIFDLEPDEEKGIFAFDEKTIDAMSFFLLTFFARIRVHYLFYGDYEKPAKDIFEDAIGNVTNASFANFATNIDYIDHCATYKSVGELFVDAYNNGLEED